jgi:hypothetical protein
MENKENLTTEKAIEFAKENGFDSVMFCLRINESTVYGKFLDAYLEMILIPVVGINNFITFNQLSDIYGEDNMSVRIVDEEEYKMGVFFDFILRGKEVPDEYKYNKGW